MDLLITTNSKYFIPTIVMLESLFENNHQEDIKIFLLFSDLKKKELSYLHKFVEQIHDYKLYPIEINDDKFSNAPIINRFSKEIYYRLLAQDILPKDLTRILYLDIDIIINKSLNAFYNQDFEGNYFIVCEGIGMSKKDIEAYKRLNIPLNKKYFNSGVILYNLELLRKNVRTNVFFRYTKKYYNTLKMPDQDILNALFYDKVKYSDYRIYNCGIMHVHSLEEEQFVRKYSAILHYIGDEKPWNYNYTSRLDDVFWKYAKKTIVKRKYLLYRIQNNIYKFLKRTQLSHLSSGR